MADTLTIRLDPKQRRLFDAEAISRGVGPSTLARELLSERLREIRRAQIYRESEEAGERYHAALAAGEDVDMPPYEGSVGGVRVEDLVETLERRVEKGVPPDEATTGGTRP